MFRQIIRPENVNDLLIQLPKKYLSKEVEIIAFEILDKTEPDNDSRDAKVKKAFETFDKNLVTMKDFKFNRDEANER